MTAKKGTYKLELFYNQGKGLVLINIDTFKEAMLHLNSFGNISPKMLTDFKISKV